MKAAFIIPLLLVLAACNGDSEINRDYFSGTTGLELEFLPQQPPDKLVEGSYMLVTVKAHNTGAHDLVGEEAAYVLLGYDSLYLTPQTPVEPKYLELHGKSQGFPEGEKEILEVHESGFEINQLTGQVLRPSTQVYVSACYPYKTTFTGTICIEAHPRYTQARPEDQVCTAQEQNYGGGQGAPVIITKIEPQLIPEQNGDRYETRPAFKVTIRNTGGGAVFGPLDSADTLQEFCVAGANTNVVDNPRRFPGTVRISGEILGEPVTCSPEEIRLLNYEGVTFCKATETYFQQSGYESTLFLELDYTYSKLFSKDVTVERLR